MNIEQLFCHLFNEFAQPIRVTHDLVDFPKSARLNGSESLIVSLGKRGGKPTIGIRAGRLGDHTSHPGFLWVSAGEAGGLLADISPEFERSPEKSLMAAFLARAEELEKELTS